MLAYAHAPTAAPPSREGLEALLRARKLDVTLALVPGARPLPPDRLAPTGDAELDARLGGGLRRGQVSELTGPVSSGRATLVASLLAAATDRGEAVALVDTADTFDPASAAACGVHLSRLLWVRDRGDAARALKACSLILQAGGFGLVVFDLADVPPREIRGFPPTTWMRLARIVEGSDITVLVVGRERIGRSAGGATLALGAAPARWRGTADRARVLDPIAPVPRVIAGR